MGSKSPVSAKNKFSTSNNKKRPDQVKLALLLEGGGCYGAFTAGALVALLEYMRDNKHITIDLVTGTSAGAMNGGILTHAMNMHDDRAEGINQAINDLTSFWNDIKLPEMILSDTLLIQLSNYAQLMASIYPFSMGQPQILSMLHSNLSKYVKDDNFLNLTAPNKIKLFTNTVQLDLDTNIGYEMVHDSVTKTQNINAIIASAALKQFGHHKDKNVTLHPALKDKKNIILLDGAYSRNCFMPALATKRHDILAISLHSKDALDTYSTKPNATLIPGDIVHNSLHYELNEQALRQNSPRLHGIHHIPPQNASDFDRMIARAERVDNLFKQGLETMENHLQEYGHLLGIEHTRARTIAGLQSQWATRNNHLHKQYPPHAA